MKSKPKILTLVSGILKVLLGIFIGVVGTYIILFSIDQYDPLLLVVTFGLLIIFQIILFLIVLGIGIGVLASGASEIRLGLRSDYEFSLRKGQSIGNVIWDFIVLIGGIVFIAFASSDLSLAIGILIISILSICIIFKIVDLILFRKRANKGLVSTAAQTVVVEKIEQPVIPPAPAALEVKEQLKSEIKEEQVKIAKPKPKASITKTKTVQKNSIDKTSTKPKTQTKSKTISKK